MGEAGIAMVLSGSLLVEPIGQLLIVSIDDTYGWRG